MNAVIINTSQGKVFWEKIVDNVDFRPYDFDAYVQLVGGALKHGVNYPIERDSFWKDFYTKKIHHVIKNYTSVSFFQRVRRYLRRKLLYVRKISISE